VASRSRDAAVAEISLGGRKRGVEFLKIRRGRADNDRPARIPEQPLEVATMKRFVKPGGQVLACLIGVLVAGGGPAEAGGPFRRGPRLVATAAHPSEVAVSPGLGTFYPTPYITVRGNAPVGGGYTPFGGYGDATLALYGPLSPLRATAAPVVVYSRGYDGVLRPTVGTTRANVSGGFRESGTPPWWDAAYNWLDQN
jgi:hypothetical protein